MHKRPRVNRTRPAGNTDRLVAAAISRWFRRSARDLPWRMRRYRTPYAAMVAEIMLQQTQVARVTERFLPFMRRFPNVKALAHADQQEVLTMWKGMGYYRRARNLHSAAQMVVRDFGGRMPRSAEELIRLPGIGRYTAGAIASIICGERSPIVDGNVQRVLARLHARAVADERWSWQRATTLVHMAHDPGAFNEGLMELGAVVCTPRSPRCGVCPIRRQCAARLAEIQNQVPAPKVQARRAVSHHHAVVITRNGHVLVEQRPDNGMWAGMWQAITIEADQSLVDSALQSALPIEVQQLRKVSEFDHLTTHRAIRVHVYRARSRVRRGTWLPRPLLADLPMSSAQRRAFEMAIQTAGEISRCSRGRSAG